MTSYLSSRGRGRARHACIAAAAKLLGYDARQKLLQKFSSGHKLLLQQPHLYELMFPGPFMIFCLFPDWRCRKPPPHWRPFLPSRLSRGPICTPEEQNSRQRRNKKQQRFSGEDETHEGHKTQESSAVVTEPRTEQSLLQPIYKRK